jgi:hypothetical protein
MTSLSALVAALQVITAFLLFIVSYLVMTIVVVLLLAATELLCEGARLVHEYSPHSRSLENHADEKGKRLAVWPHRLKRWFQHHAPGLPHSRLGGF